MLLEAAPWRGSEGPLGRLSATVSLAEGAGRAGPEAEAGIAAACCGTGSLLLLRKLGAQAGFGREGRRLLMADFTLYLLDFRLNFGRFAPGRDRECGIAFAFPLIGNASASYFLGAGYEAFLTDPGRGPSPRHFDAPPAPDPAIPPGRPLYPRLASPDFRRPVPGLGRKVRFRGMRTFCTKFRGYPFVIGTSIPGA